MTSVEVSMLLNCLILLNITATYGWRLCVLVAMLCCLAGCVQLDVSSAADCDENSKTNFCDVTSAYWWDWGDSAQTLLDRALQAKDGRVDERAMQRLIVSQEWWEVLTTWGTLGVVKPVEFTYWLEGSE